MVCTAAMLLAYRDSPSRFLLHDLAPQLRGPIGRALRLRAAPEIFFKVDESVAYAARIETLLAQIKTPAADGDAADNPAETPGAGDDDDRGD